MSDTVDVVVMGMGPGGEQVASELATAGLEVVGIEAELLGGECPYWGCIPSKMMIRAANALAEGRRVAGLAGGAEVRPDWAPVARRIREEATDTWDDQVAVDRFVATGGRFVRGRARLDGPDRVVVGDQVVEATRGVVVATGARFWLPPVPGLADTPFWTNRDAISTETVPDSLLVLGGGAIGVELAQVFRRFGAEVTIIETAPALVGLEEPEASDILAEVLGAEGTTLHLGVPVTSVRHAPSGFAVTLGDGSVRTGQQLLVAAGRRPDLAGIGAATLGVDEHARALPVDDHLRVVGTDRVWAVGDVTGEGAFTHMATYQAGIVVADVLGRDVVPADYRAVPRVTFTDPEIGSVGLTERAALEQGRRVRVGLASVPSTARGWIHKAGNEGVIKLVEDADRGILIGATSAGPTGGEVLGLLTLAVHAEVPTSTLEHMIYAYPTFHRGVQDALRNLHGV